MSDLQKVNLSLSDNAFSKLSKGRIAGLAKDSVAGKRHFLMLGKDNAKKIMKAIKGGRGCRLKLDPRELEASMNGGGLGDLIKKAVKGSIKGAKRVGKFYKDNNLKESVGPVIKEAVNKGKDAMLSAAIAFQPELAPALLALDQKLGDKLVDSLGDVTGAYGLPFGGALQSRPNPMVFFDSSNGQMVCGPVYYPVQTPYTEGAQCRSCKSQGGSFKVRGGSFKI